MENQTLINNQTITSELITIEESKSKTNQKRNSYRRLYTFNDAEANSLFRIKKMSKVSPISEETFPYKLKPISPIQPKKIHSNTKLHSYIFNTLNKKNHNIFSPLSSKTSDKEIENEKQKVKLNSQIDEFYSRYQKTYENNSMESISRRKSKHIMNLKSKEEEIKKDYSNSITNYQRNSCYSNMRSKTINNINYNCKTVKQRKKSNLFNYSYRNGINLKYGRKKNNRYRTCITEGNRKKFSILNSKKSDSFLHTKVTNLIKELKLTKNSDFYIFGQEGNNDKSSKKIKHRAKEGRGKLVSLLNRPAKSQNDGDLNIFSKKKIHKNENPMLIRKPTNNIEMNNLIINSFGAGYNHNEYSKKIFNLNETFFSLLENMKKRRAEMDIAKFEREKNKYAKKGMEKQSYDIYSQKNRDKWEKQFMLEQYQYKIPEGEFKKFKKMKQLEMRKQIIKDSQKLSQLLTNMDAEEYEFPDAISKFYKSSKNSISIKNVKRIYRVNKIMKNIEDEEQTGKIVFDANKLKKEQKRIETEIFCVIGRTGKPRFVKSIFKPRTIRKYKGISGNYFGLPA